MDQAKNSKPPPYYPPESNPPAGVYDPNLYPMTDQFQQERIGQAPPPSLYAQNYPPREFAQNNYPNYSQNLPQNYGENPFVPSHPQFNPQGGYAVGQPVYMPAMVNPGGPQIVVGVNTVTSRPYARNSQKLYCNSCKQEKMTRVSFESGDGTLIAAGVLCIVGCVPCCLIPFCVNDSMDCSHYCSHCGTYLGKIKFLT